VQNASKKLIAESTRVTRARGLKNADLSHASSSEFPRLASRVCLIRRLSFCSLDMAITQPGAKPPKQDTPAVEDEGEESDEYEVPDEEGEDDDDGDEEEEEEEEEESGGGLTALLLGGAEEDAEDQGWVPNGGKEPADYSGEEDEEEHVEKLPAKSAPSNGKANGSPAKRAREEELADDREGKKVKKV